jgi:hypothetical protein
MRINATPTSRNGTNDVAPSPPNHPAHERAIVALQFAERALAALAYAADNEVDPNIDLDLECNVDGILWTVRLYVSCLKSSAIPFPLKCRRLLDALSAAYAQTVPPTRKEELADSREQVKKLRAKQPAQNAPAGDDMPPW